MAEFEFIRWLSHKLATSHPSNEALLIPPGDDTALLPPHTAGVLFAADMLMDGVHFDLVTTLPKLIGRKALAVNLSDIAAMAGRPSSVTVCLALPKSMTGGGSEALARELMSGMLPLASEYDVAIAGGDTNSWNGPLVISVAITGVPHHEGSVLRSGANVGDWIFVTGELGGSITGKHLSFTPRINEASFLHEKYGLTAMLDLSDGLGSDLRHILNASGVGATLEAGQIPISAAARNAAKKSGKDSLYHALADGEDFELCFTIPPEKGAMLLATQPFAPDLLVHRIGTIGNQRGLFWSDGTEVTTMGWVHSL
jgi:thiamine-monophosphate kinase